jgi:hypothetical protein
MLNPNEYERPIGDDLEARSPAFFAWLRAKPSAAPETVRCKDVPTTVELSDAARFALRDEPTILDFAPLLPTRWPADGGGVVILAYEMDWLNDGPAWYRPRGPTHEITFTSLKDAPRFRRLGRGKKLKAPGFASSEEVASLSRAQQALVDLVAGCRKPEGAKYDLVYYLEWLRLHPEIGKRIEARSPAFVAWLRAKAALETSRPRPRPR